jgi:lysophospholipase L1-like esterase
MRRSFFFFVLAISLALNAAFFARYIYKKTLPPHQPTEYERRLDLLNSLPLPAGKIVLLGDSLTAEGEWPEILGRDDVVNRGIAGDTTGRILPRMGRIISGKPRTVVIMAGVNDLWNRVAIPAIVENHRQIIAAVRQGSPDTAIYLQSVLPVNPNLKNFPFGNSDVVELNRQLKSLSAELGVVYLDVHSAMIANRELDPRLTLDGLHLNGAGYARWAAHLRPIL